jgi:hypothetical protein
VRSRRRGVVDAMARHDVTSLGFPASASIADRWARSGLGRQALPGGPSRARGCGWLMGLPGLTGPTCGNKKGFRFFRNEFPFNAEFDIKNRKIFRGFRKLYFLGTYYNFWSNFYVDHLSVITMDFE